MRKFIPKDHIAELNQFKQFTITTGNQPLSMESFMNGFMTSGIPSNSNFFSECVRSGIIIRVGRGIYSWKDTKPIHYKTLQEIYSKYQKKVNEYVKRFYEKKVAEKRAEEQKVNEAIELLKDKGFIILVPEKGVYKRL